MKKEVWLSVDSWIEMGKFCIIKTCTFCPKICSRGNEKHLFYLLLNKSDWSGDERLEPWEPLYIDVLLLFFLITSFIKHISPNLDQQDYHILVLNLKNNWISCVEHCFSSGIFGNFCWLGGRVLLEFQPFPLGTMRLSCRFRCLFLPASLCPFHVYKFQRKR